MLKLANSEVALLFSRFAIVEVWILPRIKKYFCIEPFSNYLVEFLKQAKLFFRRVFFPLISLWTFFQNPSAALGHSMVLIAAPSQTSDAPLCFLLCGFALIFLFFLLLNIDKRFREYINRALLRPFNFFSDIRDQRIIPTANTILLGIMESGSIALLFGSLVYRFRNGFLANAISSGILPREPISELINLASSPYSLVLWLTIAVIGILCLLTFGLRFAAIFVRGRIFISDSLSTVVWSFLPLIFLLPYDLIVVRLDENSLTATVSLLLFLSILLWVIYRLLQGTGVLFDIYPTKLYLYGSVIMGLFLIIAGTVWPAFNLIFSRIIHALGL